MSAERDQRYYDALAAEADEQALRDLRESAIDLLTEEAVAHLPQWIRNHFDFVGEDLLVIAREYVANDTALVRERCLQIEREIE